MLPVAPRVAVDAGAGRFVEQMVRQVVASALAVPAFVESALVEPAGPAAAARFVASPESLHPALWRANQLGSGRAAVTATGFEALDAVLPGGGWPHRVLTELLLPHPGLGELRLLAPALAALAAPRHCVMLFDPPATLCGWALGQIGLDVRHWLLVQGRPRQPEWGSRWRRLGPGADVLWALEQALKSGHLGAAMAWLPAGCKADALRRLQLAAQAHDGPVFVFREMQACSRPSVAPLRLRLMPAGIDALSLRLLKRRGPPLAEPLRLVLPRALPHALPHFLSPSHHAVDRPAPAGFVA